MSETNNAASIRNKDIRSKDTHNNALDKRDILDAVKSYLSDYPADYGGHFENLLEFIYWYYSECNCEENEAARKAYVEFWDKLCEACERIAREAGTAEADGGTDGVIVA